MSTSAAPTGLGRQLALLAATGVVVVAAAAGGAAGLVGPVSAASSSRVAADRACAPVASDPVPVLAGTIVSAEVVGRAEAPTSLALRPGTDGDGVLGERRGRLVEVQDGEVTGRVVLDLSADTTGDGDGGLLGVAYDPHEPWLYVYRATEARDDVVTAYPLDAAGLPRQQDEREILLVDHPPSKQHHGGSFLIDPGGLLYVGLGDGGGLGDPLENAQDPSTLLGKVLRIDPTPGDEQPYAVPSDNPFVGRHGWRPEIWVLGVRNPFRMSLDEATGDLWLGDVGQSCWEELDRIPAAGGANLGWDRREAAADFEGGEVPGRELLPVAARPHVDGWCAIVAGYVPRDSAAPALDGWLLHTDYCAGRILALRTDGAPGAPPELRDLGVHVAAPIAIVPGPAGRPWVLSLDGEVLELRAR